MPDNTKPVGQLKPVDSGLKPIGQLKPVQSNLSPIGQLKEGDMNTIQPTYTSPIERQVDSAIDFINKKAISDGRVEINEDRKNVLRDVLINPNSTAEQKKKAILTVQGYDTETSGDVSNKFYMKKEENGVYVPTLIKSGTRPPKDAAINSFHGSQNDANDDHWYTDLSKSFANGVISTAGGLVDLAQAGTALVAGEESAMLNDARNSVDFFKFKKDEDLNAPIYNTEGINKWADLLDKDRLDLSPKALWGTLNGLTESLTEFGLGTLTGGSIMKGVKAGKYALQGVEKAVELGNAAQKGSIFFGSMVAQIGENLDAGRDAGLKGRDLGAMALAITIPMAAIDATVGLDGKIMSSLFQKSKRQILENAIKMAEKNAAGEFTEKGFKQLAKQTSIQYGELARNGIKEIVKDGALEGGQEGSQTFVQKAGENLWDKMTDDERGQYGTDAFSAKSFGEYINSIAVGAISGVPMAVSEHSLREKHDNQSTNIYDRVKEGKVGVDALRTDLTEALNSNDISQAEHDEAIFKIDAYGKYHEETKGVNLQPVDEKKAFELSFQIQGLKTEIPTNENEISKLDPIPRSKVESKQKQVKELQSELNDIIRNGEIKGEPVVPKKEEERIIKEREKESKLKESHKTAKENRWEELIDNSVSEKELDAVLSQMDNSNQTTPDLIDYVGLKRAEFIKDKEKANLKLKQKDASSPNENFPIEPKVEKKPERAYITDKRTYKEVPAEEFNHSKTDDRLIHRLARKEIWEQPNHEVNGQLYLHQYEYNGKKNRTIRVKLEDGKILKIGSSKIIDENGLSGHLHTERFKGDIANEPVGVKVVELAPEEVDGKIVRKRVIKIYQKSSGKFLAYVKETHTGAKNAEDKHGKALYSQEQIKGELEDIKLQDENPLPPEEVEALRNTPIVPIIPKTIKEKAAHATEKIVKEGKEKVKTSKKAENGKQESAVNGEKPATGSVEEANGEIGKPHKESVKKGGVKAILRKPKEVNRVNAGKIAPDSPYHDVMKYFIDGGRVSKEAIRKLYKDSIGEVQAKNNITYSEKKYDKKYAPNLDELAHTLWENAPKELGDVTTEEYKDALELVLQKYDSPIEMAKDYIKALGEKERVAPSEAEQVIIEAYDKLNEELGYKLDIGIDYFEGKTDEELKAIAEKDKWEEGTDIVTNESEGEPFQKVSQRKGDFSKVKDVIQNSFPKINVEVNVDKFDKSQSTVAGKVSADGKNIYLNPNYAGLDTPIHEAGHVLIDAMGYDNKVIQAAIKQLRSTPLYAETKKNYKELSEQELDKEVLAEAIGREGADIFDNVNDKSKFKQYLDYIFDWFKRKLGIEKNVAKSLAKQIISGVGTKGLKGTETGKEQLSKKTKEKNPIGPRPLNFQQYAAENGFSYEKETEKIEEAKVNLDEAKENEQEALVNGTEEEYDKASKELKDAKKAYSIAGKKTFEYKQYKEDFATIQEILKTKDLESYTTEELQDLIAKTHGFSDKASKAIKREAMLKLSYAVRKEQIDFLNDNNASYIESIADKKDIGALDVKLLNLSHFKEHQPEMQAGAKIIGNAFMDRIADANTRKDIHEKLAVKVIQEENKKLGIVGIAASRWSGDSAKYFDWMDKNGELLTVKEAEDVGLSQAKINYLKFTRETISDFNDEMTANDFENVIMDSIKVDKGFKEAFKSEGFVTAFSYYLGGGGANLGKVRIMHNGKPMAYSEIEKDIISKVKKNDIVGIIKALFDLLVANVSARRQLKRGFNVDEKENPLEVKGMAEYSLNSKGQLVSKFDKPRSKDRGYSKDFYRAMNQFIDESAHVKHMSKIMPLVESLEYLNANGYTEKGIAMKPNIEEWIKQWKALHIFKEPYVNDPILDASIKFMRKLVSLTTMAFNIPANTINVAVGNYNSWRQENAKTLAIGNKRLFLTKGERAGLGTVSKYALDIIKKYNVVNQDYDSQPTMRAGTIFSRLANIGTQVGEYQIQGSLGLGLLSEDEFNSFEYTKDKYGNEILTLKPNSKFSEADIKTKMLSIKNRVTDIQGKYPDEDRRNIMRGEIGKAAFQFKVWMPDWFKERFGAKYINAFGVEKEGSIHALYGEGFKQIYADLKKGNFKELSNNKKFMSNFKGLLAIGTLLALTHKDDDDEEVRGKVSTAQNLIGQILFIMDPEQVKYTVSNPIAVLGKAKDAISAIQAIATLDEKAFEKSKRVIPAFSKLEKDYDLVKNLIE